MEKTMIVDTNLGMVNYLIVVNEIANEYFDANGEYTPHLGMMNAMRTFYSLCVKESRFDEKIAHDTTDPLKMEEIMCDKEFIEEFNKAIHVDRVCLDFANAHRDALEIVSTKRGSIARLFGSIKKMFNELVTQANNAVTKENIEAISAIVENIKNGELNVNNFMESYADSKMFGKILQMKKEE